MFEARVERVHDFTEPLRYTNQFVALSFARFQQGALVRIVPLHKPELRQKFRATPGFSVNGARVVSGSVAFDPRRRR